MKLKESKKKRKSNKAHVDLSTGEIYFCDKDSWKWYHEKGHLEFNKLPDTSWLLMLKSYLFDFWMAFMTFGFIYKKIYYLSLVCFLSYVFIELYEEYWCNQYADKHYIKRI